MRKRSVLAVMMTFALVGCGKKEAKLPPAGDSPSGGGGGLSVGGGGGVVQGTRKAVRRTEALNELKNLAETIEFMRDPLGKMPSKDAIMAEAKKSLPNVYKGLTEGSYVLADPIQPGGLWAYEADADTKAGIAVIGGRAGRSTPDDLEQYFAAMPKKAAPTQPAQPPVVQP
ncbi:MAG TPA: hypothetical protein VMZ71_05875, partial [Gemmataceae bacterium]|nr:hypothetical protein [Gemmataceae bacterium]